MNTTRTTHKTYAFTHPFSLDGYAQRFLPGLYSIEIEEALSSRRGRLDFRWVKSRLYFTPKSGAPIEIGVCGIDPDDFDRAALQDGARYLKDHRTVRGRSKISPFDRLAIERSENEGMSVK
ncbi:hypothetical protein [Thalassospira sp. CH_XMU1448-2]|uniref:hypothetical protein n=1 Tax=Thalassospira sp. CH_XMU1448-2 TaxID=3107773 RepID=UPI0030098AD0